jgi:2-oxo-4-hydroxy-4-carboxy--5-ureidoimidazoline (OHCU) decarboxylase
MRERLQHAREEELGTGLDELVAIALDRWQSR